jgi:hypothetical protein
MEVSQPFRDANGSRAGRAVHRLLGASRIHGTWETSAIADGEDDEDRDSGGAWP